MSVLVVDIETAPATECPPEPSADPAKVPGVAHHQIVVLGVLWMDPLYETKRIAVLDEGKSEATALRSFAKLLDERTPMLVTFNGRGFDLPVIVMRCMRYGIALRSYLRDRRRYKTEHHLDLMDFVADFGASKYSSLSALAKLCGMPGKIGIDGSKVAELVAAGRLADVRAYCLCDVVQTAAVFLRVQLIRGLLDLERYRAATTSLLDAARRDARLGELAGKWDEPRLMLRDYEGKSDQ